MVYFNVFYINFSLSAVKLNSLGLVREVFICISHYKFIRSSFLKK